MKPINLDNYLIDLPCPFCGGKAKIEDATVPGYGKGWFRIFCADCGAWRAGGPTPEDAENLWNQRSGKNEIHCHRCGLDWMIFQVNHKDGVYCPNCPNYKDIHASLSIIRDKQ